MIEHALSAHHDVTHGAGLAVLNPAWMRFAARTNPSKFVQFAERIFGLSSAGKNGLDVALEGIDKFEEFLRSIGCPTRLSELGIGDDLFEQYAEDAALVLRDEDGNLLGRPPMSKSDIVEMLRSAL
jgi:alcohol dehydrogenase YqhD (iron-dependent ADH family)